MTYHPSTIAVHADDRINITTDVAPPIHTATTFRYPKNPDDYEPAPTEGEYLDLSTPLVYSRLTNSNINRLETILAPLIFPSAKEEQLSSLGNHVITYSSGLSAFHALLVNVVPKVIAIGGGYHGCHGVIDLHKKMHGVKTVHLHASDAEWDAAGLGKGDLVHLETPINPTGTAFNITTFAERAHKRGALLSIDATFGPQYIGGHSDMLCGILATTNTTEGTRRARTLRTERLFLGSVMGNLEGWLGVRSLRTYDLRIKRQSSSAEKLVRSLNDSVTSNTADSEMVKKVVRKVEHASLQTDDFEWLKKQMPNGFGPVFSIYTQTIDQARRLPSKLKLFHHATSLGGVESLIEWRRMSDTTVDETLLRVSVGVEDWEDLKGDFLAAFKALVEGNGRSVQKGAQVQVGQEGARVPEAGSGAV